MSRHSKRNPRLSAACHVAFAPSTQLAGYQDGLLDVVDTSSPSQSVKCLQGSLSPSSVHLSATSISGGSQGHFTSGAVARLDFSWEPAACDTADGFFSCRAVGLVLFPDSQLPHPPSPVPARSSTGDLDPGAAGLPATANTVASRHAIVTSTAITIRMRLDASLAFRPASCGSLSIIINCHRKKNRGNVCLILQGKHSGSGFCHGHVHGHGPDSLVSPSLQSHSEAASE